jgi:hypothetical protein
MKRSTDANGQIGRHLHIRFFHIPDDGLPTIVHMDMLDADNLLASASKASKNLNLGRKSPH